MIYKSVKGAKDILPADSSAWLFIESVIREVMDAFAYREIRTPIFEETAVFARAIGEETDIVGKEMYTFTDKGGTSLTLRPEMTASVVRAHIQHNMSEQGAHQKLYYIGPMFRQERPQAGRLRQFHQFGAESIGSDSAMCDAEIIAVAAEVYSRLGVTFELRVNSVGDPLCRPVYRAALREYLERVIDLLTPESRRRTETNPLRVLDSKAAEDIEATLEAPRILDYLTPESRQHFDAVLRYLEDLGIPATVDPRLVRGLDYYTKTAFEFVSGELGSQDALGGGGRYDGLAEEFGSRHTPAVGFAAGMERLLIALGKADYSFPESAPAVFFIGLDEESRRLCFREAMKFRRSGISADFDFLGRSFKAQMREANRSNAPRAIIVGERERETGSAIVKDMSSGAQDSVGIDDLLAYFSTMRDQNRRLPTSS